MEDIDGGLHPAVDGQSLDEDEDEDITYIILRFVCLFVGCLTSQQQASVSQDGSAQTILHAATLR